MRKTDKFITYKMETNLKIVSVLFFLTLFLLTKQYNYGIFKVEKYF